MSSNFPKYKRFTSEFLGPQEISIFSTPFLTTFEHFFLAKHGKLLDYLIFPFELGLHSIPSFTFQSVIKLNKNLHSSEEDITVLVGGCTANCTAVSLWNGTNITSVEWCNFVEQTTTLLKVMVIFLLSFLVVEYILECYFHSHF